MDLALNNLQKVIYHKTQTNKQCLKILKAMFVNVMSLQMETFNIVMLLYYKRE